MYKIINKIDSVFQYSCIDEHLLISFKNNDNSGIVSRLKLPVFTTERRKEINTYLCSFLAGDNSFLTTDLNNDIRIYNYELEILESLPPFLRSGINHSFSNNIVVYQGRIKNREFGIYSVSNRKVLWMDSNQKALELFENHLFGQNDYLLHRTDILNGDILWKQDFTSIYPELAEEKGGVNLLGVNNDILIVGIENKDKLFALDIETGAIKWVIDTFIKGFCVDKEKGLLHQMMVNYAAFDLYTGKLAENYRDNTYFETMGIESQRNNFALSGDHIITTDWRKGIIGAFNTITHKFDWVHKEVGVSFPSPNPIVYCEPYLFAHDNKGILYIFEKVTSPKTDSLLI